MEIEKLKAIAYDLLVSIEQYKLRLNQVNQQIAELSKSEEEPKEQKK